MSLLELAFVFFYIGLFTIGGGLVAISLMYKPIVGGGLISEELFYNMVAISESTPGPIGINMATYIGYELHGVFGGIVTTVATVLPSLIIIIIVAKFFTRLKEQPLVQSVFSVLRPAVSGTILVAALQMFSLAILNIPESKENFSWQQVINIPEIIFYAFAFFVITKTKIHPILIIILGAIFGILFL